MRLSFSRCAVAFALVAAVGCLPDQLTDAQVSDKIADAVAAQNPGQTCDPPVATEGSCDDKNATICDGCFNCKLRTTLNVNSGTALAVAHDIPQFAVDFSKTSFSIEAWVMVHERPPQDKPAPVVLLTRAENKVLTPSSGFFALVAVKVSNDTMIGCATGTFGDVVAGPAQNALKFVALDTWHHVRCYWHKEDAALSMALDGGTPFASTVAKPGVPKAISAANALFIGRVPSVGDSFSAFSGGIDEIRILSGEAAGDFSNLHYRYNGNENGLVALYHMDLPSGGKQLKDGSPNKIDAQQTSGYNLTKPNSTVYGEAPLPSSVETCYGFLDKDVNCQTSSAPWCSSK